MMYVYWRENLSVNHFWELRDEPAASQLWSFTKNQGHRMIYADFFHSRSFHSRSFHSRSFHSRQNWTSQEGIYILLLGEVRNTLDLSRHMKCFEKVKLEKNSTSLEITMWRAKLRGKWLKWNCARGPFHNESKGFH